MSELVGSFSDESSWKIAMESMTVMASAIRSPDFGGRTKTRKIMQAIRAHGTIKFIMKNRNFRSIFIDIFTMEWLRF